MLCYAALHYSILFFLKQALSHPVSHSFSHSLTLRHMPENGEGILNPLKALSTVIELDLFWPRALVPMPKARLKILRFSHPWDFSCSFIVIWLLSSFSVAREIDDSSVGWWLAYTGPSACPLWVTPLSLLLHCAHVDCAMKRTFVSDEWFSNAVLGLILRQRLDGVSGKQRTIGVWGPRLQNFWARSKTPQKSNVSWEK